jgi:hypothetical protein
MSDEASGLEDSSDAGAALYVATRGAGSPDRAQKSSAVRPSKRPSFMRVMP